MAATVLIVDDHPGFRAAARRLLELEGYVVVGEAEDGQSGILAARALRPDFVLLDVQLPDIDGFEVAERMSVEQVRPAVVLTSSREASDYGPCLARTPACGFLPKAELSAAGIADILARVKLAIIGGGGFRVPLVYGALLAKRAARFDEVVAARRRRRAARPDRRRARRARPPSTATRLPFRTTTDLDDARRRRRLRLLRDPRRRPRGPRRSTRASRSAHGVLGQETTGPGGICFALRTIPVMVDLAERVAEPRAGRLARSTSPTPRAWSPRRSSRCSATARSASATRRRRSAAASPPRSGRRPSDLWFDYFGLNHLGWLRACATARASGCPELLADDARARGASRRAGCSAASGCARSG